MRSYEATTLIHATPARVWAVLTDVEAWPSWDSGITKAKGTCELGKTLAVSAEVAPGRTFKVKVAEMTAPGKLVLSMGMPFGLFKGVRTYTIEDTGGGTQFTLHEQFSGPMLKVIGKSIPDLTPSFEKFAAGLKQQSE